MAATATEPSGAAAARAGQDEADLMTRNGIARVRADQYLVDGYRYGNLGDALAQVRRGAAGREEGR